MSSNSNINESQSSTLDSENQEKRLPEKLFAQIIEFLEEYTTEKAEVLLKNKSKLLSILKTHRPLKTFDYQFGLTTNLIKNRCLIVFEWDNKKMVRQYYKHWGAYMWRCLTCEHYDTVMQQQKFLEEGNAHLARRMSQLVNFTYGESYLANIINVLGNVSATLLKKRKTDNDQIIAKTSADLKRKSKDDDCTSSLANSSPVQKK
uniref:Uncharacterized protein n=1 Tax=Panagrolaimus davidi TaxID=227884 RepID=A0A914P886_9BILA